MQKHSHVNIFDENRTPFQTIMLLAWPIFIEQILSTLVTYADTAMVGSLGAYATAAVSISNPALFLITGAVIAMGVGITAMVARSMGAGDILMVKRVVRQAVLIIVFMGIPLSAIYALLSRAIPQMLGAGPDVIDHAATYNLIIACGRPFAMAQMVLSSVFRGVGDTKTPLKINIFANILNVIGNYFLIYEPHRFTGFGLDFIMPGAGMGVAGAAIATAFSLVFGGVVSFYIIIKKPSVVQVRIRDGFKVEWPLMKQIGRISFPTIMERVSMQTAGMVITSLIASLGTVSLAANTLYVTAESLVFMPAFAVSSAATTLTGQFLGAKQPERAQSYVYRICGYSALIFSAMGLILFIFARQLISFFTPDEAVIELAAQCLRIVALIQPVQALAFIFAGALRGAADTWVTLIVVAISNWLVRVGLTTICIRVLGLDLVAVCYCMCADMVIRAALFFLRFRSGKWKTVYRE
ncbi:MAG: MATE family efflux transporter [Christensenellales bacterium]